MQQHLNSFSYIKIQQTDRELTIRFLCFTNEIFSLIFRFAENRKKYFIVAKAEKNVPHGGGESRKRMTICPNGVNKTVNKKSVCSPAALQLVIPVFFLRQRLLHHPRETTFSRATTRTPFIRFPVYWPFLFSRPNAFTRSTRLLSRCHRFGIFNNALTLCTFHTPVEEQSLYFYIKTIRVYAAYFFKFFFYKTRRLSIH